MNTWVALIFTLAFLSLPAGADEIPTGVLKQQIVTLKEDTYFFHWVPQTKILERTQATAYSPSAALQYAQLTSSFEVDQHLNNGLYFALDPMISQSYGLVRGNPTQMSNGKVNLENGQWSLLVLKMPKGTKILDFSPWRPKSRELESPPALSAEELTWFSKRGCKIEKSDQAFLDDDADCANAFSTYLTQANVAGYLYTWSQSSLSLCSLQHSGYGGFDGLAFVLRPSFQITTQNMTALDSTSDQNPETQSLTAALNRLWSYASDLIFNSPWKSAANSAPDMTSFAHEHLLNCSKSAQH